MTSQGPAAGLVEPRGGQVVWPVRCGVVPPLAADYVGRPESGSGLAAALVPGVTVALVPARADAGAPGWQASCGKTQLAVFAAESLWRSKAAGLLVWVTATSRASVLATYAEAAAATAGAIVAGEIEPVATRLVSWLGQTTRPWIVVLDDLGDAADLDGLWPEGPAGRVLVTARNPAAVPGERRARVVPVGAFSRREALSYLMGCLTVDPDQRLGAIDLVDDLDCEPLALAQASAVIGTSDHTCHDYRGYFAHRRQQLAGTAGAQTSPAAVTWTLCVEHAERIMPGGATRSLLAIAAVLDGRAIPGAVLTAPAARHYLAAGQPAAVIDAGKARYLVAGLERVGLLATDPAATPPAVQMNPAVAAAIRATLAPGALARAARAAADALLEVWPDHEPNAWLARDLRSCAASLQQAAGDLLWEGGCHPLLLRAGHSLGQARLAGPAVAYWRELAAVSDRILGAAHPDTVLAGQRLAEAHLAAGQAGEAIAWFQRVLAGRARILGPDHPEAIAARVSLGRALAGASQPGDAITILEKAAGDFERACGAGHLATLGAREELAAACCAAGRFADAIGLYRHTLAVRQRAQGTQHPATLATRHKLADACLAGGRVKDALSHARKVLAGRERVLEPGHPDTIAARASLAAACHAAGRMASAVQLYEQTRADCEQVLGAGHPDTLARCANLAHAYYAVGRVTDALILLRDTAARCELVLPPTDPLALAVRNSLANIAGNGTPTAARP